MGLSETPKRTLIAPAPTGNLPVEAERDPFFGEINAELAD